MPTLSTSACSPMATPSASSTVTAAARAAAGARSLRRQLFCVRQRICSTVNSFGSDFGSGPWTLGLCLKDSDGDGQSNGCELGDPCCICRPHPPYLRHYSLSLPPPQPHVCASASSPLVRDTGLNSPIHQRHQQPWRCLKHVITQLQLSHLQQ